MSMEESKAAEDAHDKVAPIEADDDAGTVDMAQAEQVLFYGEASISGPDWLKDAAQSQANFKQRLPGIGDWTIHAVADYHRALAFGFQRGVHFSHWKTLFRLNRLRGCCESD